MEKRPQFSQATVSRKECPPPLDHPSPCGQESGGKVWICSLEEGEVQVSQHSCIQEDFLDGQLEEVSNLIRGDSVTYQSLTQRNIDIVLIR